MENADIKILVTGGSGFIGTNLMGFYISKGFRVCNVDLKKPVSENHIPYWSECDIRDYAALEAAVVGFNPDYIVHLAARTDLDGKTVDDYDSNTDGVRNILNAAAKLPDLKKILITSSMLVCKAGYMPKNQLDYCPTTRYGESKVMTETIVWQNRPACDWAILRPTSIWGPWFGVPYRNFFDMVVAGHYFHIGHSSCTKTYGYVGNAVYQIDRILNTPTPGEDGKVFYLGDYEPVYIEEWANQIAAAVGRRIPRMPLWAIRCAAFAGDILSVLKIHFPMTSFRLRNMSTDNIICMDNTIRIAPDLPVDRLTGIRRTLDWMKAKGTWQKSV